MNQITVEDFDNAVKQPWSPFTCIEAQAVKRMGGELYLPTGLRTHYIPSPTRAMDIFDSHFRNPGDEHKSELQALRDSLPITLEASDPKGADSVIGGNEKV